jgi:hypothetical protein
MPWKYFIAVGLGERDVAAKTSDPGWVGIVKCTHGELLVFGTWVRSGGGATVGLSVSRPMVRDTQTIHRVSTPLRSLPLFAGRYGATGALQLLRDPTGRRPFTAVTRVQIPSGTPV